MFRLYDDMSSGNGYKVRLLLTLLGMPFDYVALDIDKAETRTVEFLQKNPNGRIPLLEIAPGDYLAESNAILFYLSEGTHFLPQDKRARAAAMQWMFFEQYSHEPNVATARYWITHKVLTPEREVQLPTKRKLGYAALDVMEGELKQRAFFAGDQMSIADIALYAYTHVAGEGGFDLSNYSGINAWLARLAATPRYIPITFRPPSRPEAA
ncbi:MAG: glutathione S-transferase family protein [Alphaproteobacteria bacterium]